MNKALFAGEFQLVSWCKAHKATEDERGDGTPAGECRVYRLESLLNLSGVVEESPQPCELADLLQQRP